MTPCLFVCLLEQLQHLPLVPRRACLPACPPEFPSTTDCVLSRGGLNQCLRQEFARSLQGMIAYSLLASVFTGLRGACFWLAGTHVVAKVRCCTIHTSRVSRSTASQELSNAFFL